MTPIQRMLVSRFKGARLVSSRVQDQAEAVLENHLAMYQQDQIDDPNEIRETRELLYDVKTKGAKKVVEDLLAQS